MNKKTLLIASSISMFLLAAGCSNNTSKEEVNDTYSSTSSGNEESQTGTSVNERQAITSDNNSIWDEKTHREAEKFAEEIVEIIEAKDMKALSEKISYPIKLDVDGKLVSIWNKEDFAGLKFKSVFDDEMTSILSSSKTLSSNWRGFMLGEGNHNIWFSPILQNSEMKITSIVDGDINEEIRVTSDYNTANWSADVHESAESFATEVINYVENEDMKSLSDLVVYPIGIKVGNDIKNINSKEEFANLKFSEVFDTTMKRDICNSRTLFNNTRGFMLGDEDNNIWFAPKKYDLTDMEIININNNKILEEN
ncbi:MAG: hypothetical protein ACI4PR_05615 [Acutalibacteraceae bacterium]